MTRKRPTAAFWAAVLLSGLAMFESSAQEPAVRLEGLPGPVTTNLPHDLPDGPGVWGARRGMIVNSDGEITIITVPTKSPSVSPTEIQWTSVKQRGGTFEHQTITQLVDGYFVTFEITHAGTVVLTRMGDPNKAYSPSDGALLSSYSLEGRLIWRAPLPSDCTSIGSVLLRSDEDGSVLVGCQRTAAELGTKQLVATYDPQGRQTRIIHTDFAFGIWAATRTETGWIVGGNDPSPEPVPAREPPPPGVYDMPYSHPSIARFVAIDAETTRPIDVSRQYFPGSKLGPIEYMPVAFRLEGPMPWIVVDRGQDNENGWYDRPEGSDHFVWRRMPFFVFSVLAELSAEHVIVGSGPLRDFGTLRPCGLLAISHDGAPRWYFEPPGPVLAAAQVGDSDEIILLTQDGADACRLDPEIRPLRLTRIRPPN